MAENGSLFTPAQAATMLNVHANTVRAWTREYSDVLSDSANGRPRLLTRRDLAIMQIIVSLRADGLAPNVVLERLRQLPETDTRQPYIEAYTEPTLPNVAPATVDTSIVLRDITALVDTRTSKLAQEMRQMDTRLRQLETRRTLAIGILIGFTLGLMIASGFILLRLP